MIGFVWEISGLVMSPVELITAAVGLYSHIGLSFVFGLSLLFICFYVDRKVRENMHEIHFENGKVSEKKNNLINETFESMKTIKLYGWDKYFHEEVLKFMAKEKENEAKTDRIYRGIGLMWNTLPRLIAPVTFVVFMSLGYPINFKGMMEVIMLLGMI